jgi:rhodanese-related sulfurtransferase
LVHAAWARCITRGKEAVSKSEALIAAAAKRAAEANLPYAGALPPREAYELWQSHPSTVLIDVRTKAEWDYVGRVPGAIEIEWNHYPAGRNPQFAEQLQAAVPDRDATVLFLCRSGGRSGAAAAAATQLGYQRAYNILEGFEGDLGPDAHRNTVGGWRHAGLPWKQT